MTKQFTSRRAPIYADIPDEKWNNWRWQLSHRLNTVEGVPSYENVSAISRLVSKVCGVTRAFRTENFRPLDLGRFNCNRNGQAENHAQNKRK